MTHRVPIEAAQAASDEKNWPLAVERWREVLDSEGHAATANAYIQLARALRTLWQDDAANDVIEQGIAHHPNDISLRTFGPTPDEISQAMLGSSARAQLLERIRAGRNNNGIYLFDARREGDDCADLPDTKFIVKYTFNGREAELGKYLYNIQNGCNDIVNLFPSIYGTASGPFGGQIYMEYLGQLRRPKHLTEDVANVLVEGLIALGAHGPTLVGRMPRAHLAAIMNCRWTDGQYKEKWTRQFEVLTGKVGGGVTEFTFLDEIMATLEEQPRKVGHHDLQWSNLRLYSRDERCSMKFIDLAAIGTNIVGAELQYFARCALDSDEDFDFFNLLSEKYARAVGERLGRIRMAAFANAITKDVTRQWKKIRGLPPRRVRRVYNDILGLYKLAEREYFRERPLIN